MTTVIKYKKIIALFFGIVNMLFIAENSIASVGTYRLSKFEEPSKDLAMQSVAAPGVVVAAVAGFVVGVVAIAAFVTGFTDGVNDARTAAQKEKQGEQLVNMVNMTKGLNNNFEKFDIII